MLAGLIFPEASLLGHLLAVSSCGLISEQAHPYYLSSAYKDIVPVGLAPTLKTLFDLNYLFKGSYLQIQSHSKVLRVRASTVTFQGRH